MAYKFAPSSLHPNGLDGAFINNLATGAISDFAALHDGLVRGKIA
jgi:hypothetical protein